VRRLRAASAALPSTATATAADDVDDAPAMDVEEAAVGADLRHAAAEVALVLAASGETLTGMATFRQPSHSDVLQSEWQKSPVCSPLCEKIQNFSVALPNVGS